MERLYYRTIPSPLGEVTICCTDRGVRTIRLGDVSSGARAKTGSALLAANGNDEAGPAVRWARQAARELDEYFGGTRQQFTAPLDLHGTAFQQKVWKALCEIPYGQTRSYGQIARAVGVPQGARAVGMANHANSVPIMVPCHRVIASDGSLGGYACGLDRKQQLLRLEKPP